MRLTSANVENFRSSSRVALPPLQESYIARIADELPWGKLADTSPDDLRTARDLRLELLLGRAVVGFMVLLILSALI